MFQTNFIFIPTEVICSVSKLLYFYAFSIATTRDCASFVVFNLRIRLPHFNMKIILFATVFRFKRLGLHVLSELVNFEFNNVKTDAGQELWSYPQQPVSLVSIYNLISMCKNDTKLQIICKILQNVLPSAFRLEVSLPCKLAYMKLNAIMVHMHSTKIEKYCKYVYKYLQMFYVKM